MTVDRALLPAAPGGLWLSAERTGSVTFLFPHALLWRMKLIVLSPRDPGGFLEEVTLSCS